MSEEEKVIKQSRQFLKSEKIIMGVASGCAILGAGFYVGYKMGNTDSQMSTPGGSEVASLFAKF
jgi:hypothetical protein